ncbi:MAG TPA: hypothetical protein VHO46_01340 [Bacteroidales bacterium]|nr:hypothetical protein [Bacteroidales bacterium]
MRILLAVLFVLLTTKVIAPDIKTLVIVESEPVDIYEKLMTAILEVECGGDTLAYNAIEDAYGPFQIRPIRLDDYNKRTGKNYRMKDCYTLKVSREVFLYYAKMFGADYETIAKRWNGSGEMTIGYWAKVQSAMSKPDKTALKSLKPES